MSQQELFTSAPAVGLPDVQAEGSGRPSETPPAEMLESAAYLLDTAVELLRRADEYCWAASDDYSSGLLAMEIRQFIGLLETNKEREPHA